MDSFDVRTGTLAALERLGARNIYISGAKLASELRREAEPFGVDFTALLREQHMTLRALLNSLESDEVVIDLRIGSDMYVGFAGAALPPPPKVASQATRLRPDVFAAFTRHDSGTFFYFIDADRFERRDPLPQQRAIQVPELTLEALIQRRRTYACQDNLGASSTESLISALETSNPLKSFADIVKTTQLANSWNAFNVDQVIALVSRWANENKLAIRSSWFDDTVAGEMVTSLRDIMAVIVGSMDDAELRAVTIPLSAIERAFVNRRFRM